MEIPHKEILSRLAMRKPLTGLGLGEDNGRLVIRGLHVPKPAETGYLKFGSSTFSLSKGTRILKNVRWDALHFLECDLAELGFFGESITNCHFTNCNCSEIGFWETKVEQCVFLNCSFNDAALGGIDIDRPRPNVFANVQFELCDFRGSAHSCERYEGCSFLDCRLDKVDFNGAVFSACDFEGQLEEVMFRASSAECPKSVNCLQNCDFRRTRLIDCSFINLDLDPIMFPKDDDLVFLPAGPLDWEAWGHAIGADADEGARLFVDYMIENAGTPSVTSKAGLREAFTEEQVEAFLRIVHSR